MSGLQISEKKLAFCETVQTLTAYLSSTIQTTQRTCLELDKKVISTLTQNRYTVESGYSHIPRDRQKMYNAKFVVAEVRL